MIEVRGKKLSQDDVNQLFIQACYDGDLAKVVTAVQEFKANINCMDSLNYARALVYALRSCEGKDSEGEQVVKYLVNQGAEINFKHGAKGEYMDSRPYFIYHAAQNTLNVSDDLVYFLIQKGAKDYLNYVPTTSKGEHYVSALDKIKFHRPNLYKKLVKEKIVVETNKR